jgi:hypothetical protein
MGSRTRTRKRIGKVRNTKVRENSKVRIIRSKWEGIAIASVARKDPVGLAKVRQSRIETGRHLMDVKPLLHFFQW